MSARKQPIALVTGGSRGVGRGVAIGLVEAGFCVYATGRSIAAAELPNEVRRLPCDHLRDEETDKVFQTIEANGAALDLLVNCAWGGYERMVENGVFTWPAPFWEQPMHRWTSMMDAGVRAAYVCSARAAKLMVPQRRGLMVNISFWAAQKRIGFMEFRTYMSHPWQSPLVACDEPCFAHSRKQAFDPLGRNAPNA